MEQLNSDRRYYDHKADLCLEDYDEWEKTAIPFEESLSEEQTILFHKLCDLQSETAANEMRAAYKAGFKDGIVLITE